MARCCWRCSPTTASAPWWSTRSSRACARPTADDVGGILQLIEPFERDGTLVKRERTEIERDIANYTVIEHDGMIFGCAALYPYPEARTGEMAALTVSPQVQGQGDGERHPQAHRATRARHRAGKHIRADHAHDALVHQARLRSRSMPTGCPRRARRKYNWDRRSQVLVKKLA